VPVGGRLLLDYRQQLSLENGQMPIIKIDYDLCTSCGLCVDLCTIRLLVSEDGLAKPRGDRVEDTRITGGTVEYDAPGCSACRICEISCPVEAIVIEV